MYTHEFPLHIQPLSLLTWARLAYGLLCEGAALMPPEMLAEWRGIRLALETAPDQVIEEGL